MVERRAERHDALARELPVRGFETHRAARRRRNADGAAGIGAEGTKAHARRQGGRGAAARTAGGACRDVERIRTGPNAVSSLVVPNANSCRLVLPMMMAPAARSRTLPARRRRHDCRHGRSRRRLDAGDVDQILSRDWNAVQRPAIAARSGSLRPRSSASASARVVEPRDEGVDLRPRVDARKAGLNEARRGTAPRIGRGARCRQFGRRSGVMTDSWKPALSGRVRALGCSRASSSTSASRRAAVDCANDSSRGLSRVVRVVPRRRIAAANQSSIREPSGTHCRVVAFENR